MSLAASTRRFFSTASVETFDPQTYWNHRHERHEGSLKAVGLRTLTEQQNQAQYSEKVKRITGVIKHFIPPSRGKTLLDAGCGVGVLTQAYVDLEFCTTGADFTRIAVEQARRRVPDATFVVSPLSSLKLDPGFDVICVIDVLLHIVQEDEWLATLATLTAHLKPGGLMIVLDCLNPGETRWARHCRPRTLEQCQSALTHLGCTIVQHERFALEHLSKHKDLVTIRHTS